MRNPEVDYQHTTPATHFIEVWKVGDDTFQIKPLDISFLKPSTEGGVLGHSTVCVFKIHPLK